MSYNKSNNNNTNNNSNSGKNTATIKNNYGSISTSISSSSVNATSTQQSSHHSLNATAGAAMSLHVEPPMNGSSANYSLLVPSVSFSPATDNTGCIDNDLLQSNNNSNNNNSDNYANMSTNEVTTSQLPPSRAKKLWKKLASQVNDGEFLLPSSSISGDYDTNDVENNNNNDAGGLFHQSFRSDTNNNNNYDDGDSVSRRERAVAAIQNALQFTLGQCMVAIIVYLGIAVLAFSFVLEHWTIIDSMYFAVVTFTTIGYGDIAPDSAAGRTFTCFFALSGVACLGIALVVVGTNLMESQSAAIEQADDISKQQTFSFFAAAAEDCPKHTHDPLAINNINDNNNPECPITTKHESTKVTETDNTALTGLYRIGFEFIIVLLILFIFAICLIIVDPAIEVDDALYFTIVTATTVGYGDYAPKSQIGRFVSIIFIPITVGAMGHWLSVVASYIMDHRQSSFHQRLNTSTLTIQDLELMDTDNDGAVTFVEFLEFMLRIMNKVDTTTFKELKCLFNKLDTDGTGTLSKHDLIVMAQNKLHTNPIRKLQLAAYKHKLLSIHPSNSIILKGGPNTTTTAITTAITTSVTTTEQQNTR